MNDIKHRAKAIADFLLKNVWEDREMPVDPVFMAHHFDINVYSMDNLPQEVSGAILKTKDAPRPFIVVNAKHTKTRRRFTVAHELGHYLLYLFGTDEDNPFNNEEVEIVEYRDKNASNGIDNKEVFSNQFAAYLLMPDDMVRKNRDAESLAEVCFVSQEAASNRLDSFGKV